MNIKEEIIKIKAELVYLKYFIYLLTTLVSTNLGVNLLN